MDRTQNLSSGRPLIACASSSNCSKWSFQLSDTTFLFGSNEDYPLERWKVSGYGFSFTGKCRLQKFYNAPGLAPRVLVKAICRAKILDCGVKGRNYLRAYVVTDDGDNDDDSEVGNYYFLHGTAFAVYGPPCPPQPLKAWQWVLAFASAIGLSASGIAFGVYKVTSKGSTTRFFVGGPSESGRSTAVAYSRLPQDFNLDGEEDGSSITGGNDDDENQEDEDAEKRPVMTMRRTPPPPSSPLVFDKTEVCPVNVFFEQEMEKKPPKSGAN